MPPRIVEPSPTPSTLEPVDDLPPERPLPTTSRPRPPAARDPSRDTQKPTDSKPPETATPPPVEPPPPPPANAPGVIRTPATADAAAAERQIRDTLGRTQTRLNNVDYRRLSGQLQKAYNEAKDFMERAEAAIRSSNFELAKGLASTAEKLVNELPTTR